MGAHKSIANQRNSHLSYATANQSRFLSNAAAAQNAKATAQNSKRVRIIIKHYDLIHYDRSNLRMFAD